MFLFQFSNYATVVEPELSWLDYHTPRVRLRVRVCVCACECVKEFVYKLKRG